MPVPFSIACYSTSPRSASKAICTDGRTNDVLACSAHHAVRTRGVTSPGGDVEISRGFEVKLRGKVLNGGLITASPWPGVDHVSNASTHWVGLQKQR